MKKTVYILSASLLVGIALSFLPSQLNLGATYKFNPFTNNLDRVDTTTSTSSGGSTTTLTATQVAYGDPNNLVTSSPNFTFNSTTNQLTVTQANLGSLTSTWAYFTTNTIAGGFFQDGLSTCNADNETLAYNATTGKFGCGDDDSGAGAVSLTNTLLAFGDAANQITSSTALSFNTTSLRLIVNGTVSSTSVSTTNISLLNFTNGSVIFTTSSGLLSQDNSGLFFDSVSNRLGINTTTLATNLVIDGDAEITSDLVVGRGLSSAGWQTGLSIYAFGGERPAIAKNNTTGKIGYIASGGTQGHELITSGRSVLINTRSESGTTEFTTAGGITSYTNAALDIVGTWNNSSTRFWAIRSNFTDTGSNATTSLIDLMVGSVTKFNVQKDGWVSIATSTPIAALTLNASTTVTGGLAFGTDVNLYRSGTDILRTDDSFQIGGALQFVTATGTSVTSTNLSVSGPSALAGLTFTNATGTGQFRIATTTITGGFFQTDLTDCTSDTAAVSYNATTGKFGCGDDDTGTGSVVSSTLANAAVFTDLSPASFADNDTTELWNDSPRPNITPQSANNPVLINVSYMIRGASTADNDFVIRVVRENDPGSTTPTCNLTSDAQVGASSVGGTLISAFTTNLTDRQTANGTLIDFPATTTAVYYTICTSSSSTVSAAPTSSVLHVGLTEIQGSGASAAREYTQIYTASTTWTKPATSTGFIGVRAWVVGGGGGGGGSGSAGNIGAGGGGAGSGFSTILAASLSATTSVTVGTAGTGGAAGNNDGVAGGTSSFGSHISCSGGGGGNDGASGAGGGAAGTCTGADISGSGISGQTSGTYTDSYRGYGGSAGVDQGFPLSEPQDAISRIIPASGILGMYAGAGGTRPPSWDANSRNGGKGARYGSGGSGGQKVGAGADASGADGWQGIVVIQELYQ